MNIRFLPFLAVVAALVPAPLPGWSHPGADAALDHYSHVLEHSPEDTAARLARATLLISEGRLAAAATDLAHLDRTTDGLELDYLWGELALRSGEPARAAERFTQCIDAPVPDYRCYRLRGHAWLAQGRTEAALEDLLTAARYQRPFNPGLILETVSLANELGKTSTGLELIDRVQREQGVLPQLQLRTVEILAERRQFKPALARLEALIEALGANPQWLLLRAALLAGTGNLAEASTVLTEVTADLSGRRNTPWQQDILKQAGDLQSMLDDCAVADCTAGFSALAVKATGASDT